MKNRIVKIVVAALAFLLMVVNTAEASFRVKKPSSAVRQQALMSLQSVGTSENETVETTTKEKPFTVDFAALGVENPTNAYLLIVNEQTGNCVELSAFNSGENKIQISPLVMAELEMQYLFLSGGICLLPAIQAATWPSQSYKAYHPCSIQGTVHPNSADG